MKQKSSRSALFLMELIFSILFFALASAVCVQLFVKAHLLSVSTQELNHALTSAQSAAASLQAKQGDAAAALGVLGGEGDTLYYNANWQPCAEAEAAYTLQLLPAAEDETTNIVVTKLGETAPLLTLPVRCHTPLTAE